jgi:CBS domain-containing protein
MNVLGINAYHGDVSAALVREGGRLVGIVNRYDVLREVAGIG